MYLYSLHGYEHNEVLTHTKEFTQEEFESMCDEIPKLEPWEDYFCYDDTKVREHLIDTYKFKKAKYQANLFVD